MGGRFQAELMTALPEWKQLLREDPGQLAEVERKVHAAFSRGADLLVVGLLAAATKTPEFSQACEDTRRGAADALSRGRPRQVCVRLLAV